MFTSKISHDGPSTGWVRYWIGRFGIGLFSWDVTGHLPEGGKYIIITAPHTSNWDFPKGIFALYIMRLKGSFIAKDSLFKGLLGSLMHRLGGIAINRDSPHGVVDQIARRYKETDKLAIAIAPSGTRKKSDYWKSGFYWMAYKAQIPIVCCSFDYGRKELSLGFTLIPTGNVKEDMDRIRGFFKDIKGKYPENTSAIRLREEDS